MSGLSCNLLYRQSISKLLQFSTFHLVIFETSTAIKNSCCSTPFLKILSLRVVGLRDVFMEEFFFCEFVTNNFVPDEENYPPKLQQRTGFGYYFDVKKTRSTTGWSTTGQDRGTTGQDRSTPVFDI